MQLSAFLTSLPDDFAAAVHRVAAMGFTHVDIVAVAQRQPHDRDALANSGLIVSCAALGRNLPEACSLHHCDRHARQPAIDEVKRQLIDAAQLGATHAFLVPPAGCTSTEFDLFGEACDLLAAFASALKLRLCIEHFPGRLLPTARATLDWLVQHDRLALLLDLGHCMISNENPARVVEQASDRLGYVHLDDNDGRDDLHWPLLTGVLTRAILNDFLAALQRSYTGTMALELNARNADPQGGLASSRSIVLESLESI